ncbi:MAG: 2-oxoacid:acceptor oxidoreductase family protein [Alphaproteobacteria bacterium]|jgi:2-oxoglutarate ferredoxin oxidoreductase subunit gamma|nr:2-oxoacid:acceptor oxidoreductase family protein [Alphaproteobacteria bacterium]MDP6818557.1 2-oxoacid:acceptor oxidoreductase family protein [Alphaproteobacteria bacterium]|tara:strand:+ start:658 stop:1215 length:558 start_codon:yes stop_codon:yes gene_type:complete
MSDPANKSRHFEIRFAGSGGQGLQLSAKIFAHALIGEGLFVSQSQSYEPTSRGGLSRSDLVVGSDEPDFPLATSADFILLLDQVAVRAADGMIKQGGIVITDERLVPDPPAGDFRLLALPITDSAIAIGNPRVANVIALGVLDSLGGLCGRPALEKAVETMAPARFRQLNLEALGAGYSLAEAAG